MNTRIPATIDDADRALALAARAWGLADDPGFWNRLAADWRARHDPPRLAPRDGPDARSSLLAAHEAMVRCRPDEVHPSWFVRALREESAAVRRAAAARVEGSLREALLAGLDLSETDLTHDVAPHEDVAGWVQALWTERLVGGAPLGPDDATAVTVVAGLESRVLARLLVLIGTARWAYACQTAPLESPRIEARLVHFQRKWGTPDPRLLPLAQSDLKAAGGTSTQQLTRVGLLTLARLLAAVEPHRARWALQHLPYPIARSMRPGMSLDQPFVTPERLIEWESRTLDMAIVRLHHEAATDEEERA